MGRKQKQLTAYILYTSTCNLSLQTSVFQAARPVYVTDSSSQVWGGSRLSLHAEVQRGRRQAHWCGYSICVLATTNIIVVFFAEGMVDKAKVAEAEGKIYELEQQVGYTSLLPNGPFLPLTFIPYLTFFSSLSALFSKCTDTVYISFS